MNFLILACECKEINIFEFINKSSSCQFRTRTYFIQSDLTIIRILLISYAYGIGVMV